MSYYFGLNTATRLQNTVALPASVTITFQTSPTPVVTTVSLPAFGETEIKTSSVHGIPLEFVGTEQIQSDQPIVALARTTGGGSFGLVAMVPPRANASFYVPRFEGPGYAPWDGLLVLQTTGTGTASFTMTFYNPDGTINSAKTDSVAPGQAMVISAILDNLPVIGAFSGSALITTTGNANVVTLKAYYANFQISALASYDPPTGPPAGTVVVLPVLRKNAGTESTAFTLMNTQATTATYRIAYFDQLGDAVTNEDATVPANGVAYFSQAADGNLPPNFEGEARVAAVGGGILPIGLVEAYAQYPVPSPPSPTPTATATSPPTATPTVTPLAT